ASRSRCCRGVGPSDDAPTAGPRYGDHYSGRFLADPGAKTMLKLLTHPWLIRGVGFAALAAVVLLIGPLIAIGEWRPLASLAARWGLVAVIVAVWVGKRALAARRASKAEAGMVGEMTKPAEDDGAGEEIATIRE